MKTNNIIIALLILIIFILVAGMGYFVMSNSQNNDSKIVNDTHVENMTDAVVNATLKSNQDSESDSSVQNGNSVQSGNSAKSDSSAKHYDDWQEDYETGEYDEFGSPIYRSVYSTSGGQSEPGIYEAYWSGNGPITEERIG